MAITGSSPRTTEDPLFDPSCCTYKLSQDACELLLKLKKNKKKFKQIPEDLKQTIERMDTSAYMLLELDYSTLTELHKYLQRLIPAYIKIPFYQFLDSCECVRPEPRENKQLESRLQQLRLRHSQKQYDSMTASVDRVTETKLMSSDDNTRDDIYLTNSVGSAESKRLGGASLASEVRLLDGSFISVINSFLVFICTFIFCYKALEYALAQPNIIAQVLFGLFGSTIVACAELYFLVRVI